MSLEQNCSMLKYKENLNSQIIYGCQDLKSMEVGFNNLSQLIIRELMKLKLKKRKLQKAASEKL
jgi:hypothetical protein